MVACSVNGYTIAADFQGIILMSQLPARPDSPCVALCSTALGDDLCLGCGRTFIEVANWVCYSVTEKELVWQRLEQFWDQRGEPCPWAARDASVGN